MAKNGESAHKKPFDYFKSTYNPETVFQGLPHSTPNCFTLIESKVTCIVSPIPEMCNVCKDLVEEQTKILRELKTREEQRIKDICAQYAARHSRAPTPSPASISSYSNPCGPGKQESMIKHTDHHEKLDDCEKKSEKDHEEGNCDGTLDQQESFMLSRQINTELSAFYSYLAKVSGATCPNKLESHWEEKQNFYFQFAYYDRDEIALKGFAQYYLRLAYEELEHALKFIRYVNKRGGRARFCDVKAPERQAWACPRESIQCALDTEKKEANVNMTVELPVNPLLIIFII